jgi:hypothetical protein
MFQATMQDVATPFVDNQEKFVSLTRLTTSGPRAPTYLARQLPVDIFVFVPHILVSVRPAVGIESVDAYSKETSETKSGSPTLEETIRFF